MEFCFRKSFLLHNELFFVIICLTCAFSFELVIRICFELLVKYYSPLLPTTAMVLNFCPHFKKS